MSFRNPEEFSNLDWQMRSRVAPLRNRRDVRPKRFSNGSSMNRSNIIDSSNVTTQIISATNDTFNRQNSTDIDVQRLKRDTLECVINYNSPRQLFVGCSQSNVIEVKPHCSDEGDEGNIHSEFLFKVELLIILQLFLFFFYSVQLYWILD